MKPYKNSILHKTYRQGKAVGWLLAMLLLTTVAQAQQPKITVTGTVSDKESTEAMIGVGIMEVIGKTSKVIGVTDAKGNFSVQVSPEASLTFRFVGYREYTAKIGTYRRLDVRMSIRENKLTETVIIGYQTKTRELTTGSSVVISGKDLQDVPVSNVEQLMQGRVAGLNIQNNTGAPGGRGMIAIRGLSNITVTGSGSNSFLTPTSPLYVIDGVPIDADANFTYGFQTPGPGVSPLSLIPPEDIQTFEVLKDAQATALYGSRAAYGVIVITTRRGSSKVPVVRYTGNFFMNTPPELRATIGGNMERQIRIKEIMQNGTYADWQRISQTPFLSDSLNPYYNSSTNWQGIFYRTTYNQTHNVNISGGDPTFNYKTDLSYYHENGIIRNTGFDRYSINTNMNYQPTPKLKVFAMLNTQVGNRKLGSGNGLLQTGVASNGQSSSLLPDPSFFLTTSDMLGALEVQNNNKTLNITSSIDASYQLIDGLSLGSSVSYTYASNTSDKFVPAAANNDYSQVEAYDDRNFTLYNRNSITYYKSINKKHNFTVMGFNEIYNRGMQARVIRQDKMPNDQYQGPLGYGKEGSNGGGLLDNFSQGHTASFAGTFSYNYMQKYILDASYRMDGTSATGFKDPYSKNPSIGLRWNFSKEKFLENSSNWLYYGSLRGSWGQNIVPMADLFAIYGAYGPRGTYNGNPRIGTDFGQMPNPDLKPTTTTQYNGGVEAGFFKGRLEMVFDVYYKSVLNLLRSKPLPDITGFNSVITNETSLVNYGYELSLTFRPLPPTNPVQWSISVNGALNKDILTRLPGDARQLIQTDQGQYTVFRVGRNSLSNYLLTTKGVYGNFDDVPVDPATGLRYRADNGTFFKAGDPYWEDRDGNYILDANDYTIAGNSQPLVTGGMQSMLTYKGFSFNMNASFTAKRDILNDALVQRMQYLGQPFDQRSIVDFNSINYWKAYGGNARYPNPFDYTRAGAINPFRGDQTLFQEDGSYFKINTITLGYTLNKYITERFGLNTVRFYLTCNNVKTFSNYSGPNPENVSSLGRDQSNGYPIARSWNFGLNVQF
ncbi:TonB-linked SusC/RagA family outer membrane protein [Chitinophaga terrae (ex Kim and Jung 2007)]|uniref:SusC/RagA family TonB-linked outer membrane protein n=1 Tax=Chitinophaga terrae (ex Kim and Jung 2007) TaxID=408074 RepID=UPI002787CC8C|nr:SusC/RagA family TonB-linked outer membrane protein [Chitinophaga terrae (ex Kim and Jung 2007)]MDQ0109068.1 TonB-linked SusC/RagA family outer membrane protein [Chitinophaga terrae (ex Kim and Jung 2007)]